LDLTSLFSVLNETTTLIHTLSSRQNPRCNHLFHKPSVPASVRVSTILKQASAQASETATEDQASDHTHQNAAVTRDPFELEVTEAAPTTDQLKSIFEYVGSGKAGELVKGAASESDALRKVQQMGLFQSAGGGGLEFGEGGGGGSGE